MRQAELDIVTADGTRYNDTMEVDSSADLTDIVTAASQLLGICQWRKVRVGVGSQLSDWITTPAEQSTAVKQQKNKPYNMATSNPNLQDFQPQYRLGRRIWAPYEIDYMHEHINDGWDSIAAALHRDRTSVRQKYRSLHPKRRPSAADITTIFRMRRQGATIKQIADEVEFTTDTVNRILKKR